MTLELSTPGGSVDVDWTTDSGTAASGSDFTASNGTATVSHLLGSTTISIPISDDALLESGETFYINLSNPVGGSIDDGVGVVTINDDDAELVTRDIDRNLGGGNFVQSGATGTGHALVGGASIAYNALTLTTATLDVGTTLPNDSVVPDSIVAELFVNDNSVQTYHYEATGLSAGDDLRFQFAVDSSSLGSGTHAYRIELTEAVGPHANYRTLEGVFGVNDQTSSSVGAGWQVSGLEQLHLTADWVTLLWSNGSASSFFRDAIQEGGGGAGAGAGSGGGTGGGGSCGPGGGGPGAGPGGPGGGSGTGGGDCGGGGSGEQEHQLQDSLGGGLIEKADGTFVFTDRTRNQIHFDANGRITSRNDKNLNRTEYEFDSSNNLIRIEYQNGQDVDFAYDPAGSLTSVTDWAGRVASLSYDTT
ncbi:MAG: Calx-beta domain-containing protein, partial [Planctomycetota bacterium]